jgi:hypothetical protein
MFTKDKKDTRFYLINIIINNRSVVGVNKASNKCKEKILVDVANIDKNQLELLIIGFGG